MGLILTDQNVAALFRIVQSDVLEKVTVIGIGSSDDLIKRNLKMSVVLKLVQDYAPEFWRQSKN